MNKKNVEMIYYLQKIRMKFTMTFTVGKIEKPATINKSAKQLNSMCEVSNLLCSRVGTMAQALTGSRPVPSSRKFKSRDYDVGR